MKKIILTLAILAASLGAMAQTQVKQNSDGNYTSITKAADQETGKTFTTAKGEVFKVYQSARGKLYIIRKSKKTGTEYKQYLKID